MLLNIDTAVGIIIVFALGTEDIIYIGVNERTEIGSFIGAYNVFFLGL